MKWRISGSSYGPDRFLRASKLAADVAPLQSGQWQLDQSLRNVSRLGNDGFNALRNTKSDGAHCDLIQSVIFIQSQIASNANHSYNLCQKAYFTLRVRESVFNQHVLHSFWKWLMMGRMFSANPVIPDNRSIHSRKNLVNSILRRTNWRAVLLAMV